MPEDSSRRASLPPPPRSPRASAPFTYAPLRGSSDEPGAIRRSPHRERMPSSQTFGQAIANNETWALPIVSKYRGREKDSKEAPWYDSRLDIAGAKDKTDKTKNVAVGGSDL